MADRKMRIGFVGVGGMGQCAHLRNYVTVPDCEVVAIAELRRELGRKVAAALRRPAVYADHEEMLAKEKLDGIVASQPFTRHGVLLPELLKAGDPGVHREAAGRLDRGGREDPRRRCKAAARGTWSATTSAATRPPCTPRRRSTGCKATGELGKLRYVRILMPAGDWVASGFTDLIRSDEPMPAAGRAIRRPRDMDEADLQRSTSAS